MLSLEYIAGLADGEGCVGAKPQYLKRIEIGKKKRVNTLLLA